MEINTLSPQIIWKNFCKLNAIPRPSKKEEKVIAFIKNFGENLGLTTIVEEIGNVIIKKPATAGMEERKTVILQSHLDMVCQKNAATNFNFETQGINMLIEGDWVTADGTTLGADNGIGVATIMSILESDNIPHPAIEALFTIDEETGMTGAFNLNANMLQGEILLNLDTEDDDEFAIGCAGGIDTNTTYAYQQQAATGKSYKIEVKGLKGGHSGVDIHLERANANKIMNRLMVNTENYGLCIAEVDGGSLRNAIPRESTATITVENDDYLVDFENRKKAILKELAISDPNAEISINPSKLPNKTTTLSETIKITNALQAVYNGVFKMSLTIKGLVETSSSLARVIIKNGKFITQSLQRSSVESGKMEIAHTVASAFKLMGCEVAHTGSYPGWEPNTNSEILDLMKAKYKTLFGENPKVAACHAGLECGILGVNYPQVDMISFGPTIKNPHSPDEKVNIKTVGKFWDLLLAVLADIPAKN